MLSRPLGRQERERHGNFVSFLGSAGRVLPPAAPSAPSAPYPQKVGSAEAFGRPVRHALPRFRMGSSRAPLTRTKRPFQPSPEFVRTLLASMSCVVPLSPPPGLPVVVGYHIGAPSPFHSVFRANDGRKTSPLTGRYLRRDIQKVYKKARFCKLPGV